MTLYSFISPVAARPNAVAAALRQAAYPLDGRTPERLRRLLKEMDARR